MNVQPYLFFHDGRCAEAVAFYQRALGAEMDLLMRFRDAPEAPGEGCVAPGSDDKIMHASFRVGDSTIMASDGSGLEKGGFDGFCLSITVGTPAEADRFFAALSEDGTVTMPLGATFWSPRFGSVKDRFGVHWMLNTLPAT